MSSDSCLVDLVRVETDPNYVSTLKQLRDIRPELHRKANTSDSAYFQSRYAVALFFIMNSCENCDRMKFIKRRGDSGFVEGVRAITEECQLARQRQLGQLPIEDTVWSLDRIVDETDTTQVILVIQDRRSVVVGFTVWDTSDPSEHVHLALCTACLFPVVHRPRRPRYFCVRDKDLAKRCELAVDRLGITWIMGPNLPTMSSQSHAVHTRADTPQLFRECNVCRFRAEREMFHTCAGCGAMLYCTQTCCENDWGQEGQTTLYNHSKWCHRLQTYMEEERQLVDLPFTFTTETTHPEFGLLQLEAFLQRIGLFGRDLWQWVCPASSSFSVVRTHGTGFFKNYQNPFWIMKENACSIEGQAGNTSTQGNQLWDSGSQVDGSEDPGSQVDGSEDPGSQVDQSENLHTLLDQSGDSCTIRGQSRNHDTPGGQSESGCDPLTDWASYYRYRGLSLDSPVAVLLQWPLTMYHILTSCLSQDYGCGLAEDRPVILDILGVEQEVDLYPVFQELGYLMPGHDFVINLFGKNISKAVDRCVKVVGRVKVKVYRRLYHNYTHRWKPDLAIGFNAGIAAYPSWRDTIRKLEGEKTPAYFTDYCHYSADLGRDVVREGCGLETSTPIVNPFRSPMRRVCDQHLLPWFSNAFLFHLIYSPIADTPPIC